MPDKIIFDIFQHNDKVKEIRGGTLKKLDDRFNLSTVPNPDNTSGILFRLATKIGSTYQVELIGKHDFGSYAYVIVEDNQTRGKLIGVGSASEGLLLTGSAISNLLA